MKLHKNSKNYCLTAISITPEILIKMKQLNKILENKSRLKFGDSFIMREALEDFLNKKDVESYLLNKKLNHIVVGEKNNVHHSMEVGKTEDSRP